MMAEGDIPTGEAGAGGAWRGVYWDGRTAVRHEVRVWPSSEGVRVEGAGDTDLLWSFAEFELAQGRYRDQHVRLEKRGGSGAALVFAGRSVLGELQRLAPAGDGRFAEVNPSDGWRRSVAATLVLFLMIGGAYFWAIPAAADRAGDFVPVSWEERLGATAVNLHVTGCSDPDVSAALGEMLDRLVATVPVTHYTFRVFVTQSPVVNAFAAPGGYIVIHRGLLEQTERPEQLAGILAHEMQHVIQRHSTRALFRQTSFSALASMLGSNAIGNTFALNAARSVGELRFSREDEAAADEAGMRMLQAAEIDAQGMVEAYEILARQPGQLSGVAQYVSTHPAIEERIRVLGQMASKAAYKPVALANGAGWRRVRSGCGPDVTVLSAEEAPTQGNPDIWYMTGNMHFLGKGVPQDYEAAMRWYRHAADQGHADAQFSVGFLYSEDLGVPVNHEEGIRWYRMAADQGHARAQSALGYKYQMGLGTAVDYEEAMRWYLLAAEQGNPDAQFNIGYMYMTGEGVPRDDQEAGRWLQMAAENGHEDARKWLGLGE